jgi:lysozyme
MVQGIDVSHWNGAIDWTAAARDPKASFAYIKATEGRTFLDDRFAANWSGAAAAGVWRGAYHVLREPSSSHVDAQVEHFCSTVGPHVSGDLPPALDVEGRFLQAILDDFRARGSSRADSRQQARQWLLSWLQQVHARLGVRPILYMGLSSVIHKLARDAGGLTDYALWYVRYRRTPNLPEDRHGNLIWPRFTIWQHTSSGHVQGISGRVDLNRFNGELVGFVNWKDGITGDSNRLGAPSHRRANPTWWQGHPPPHHLNLAGQGAALFYPDEVI